MRATPGRDEGGLTLVLVAMSMVVLLGFSAFVLDFGAVYNHRRQDQNAADSAALAAARELPNTESDLVAAAKSYAHETLGTTLTSTEWNSCAGDSGALQVVAAGSNCITYNAGQVRVRIPDQDYETTFGSVLGVDEIRHGAFAIAGLSPEGFGGVLPFAVTGVNADGGFGCLKTNSNGAASPWCGSTSGNFGFMDFSQFGNTTLGTSESCGNGDFNMRVRNNIAMGVDHQLSLVGTVWATPKVDVVACQADPNSLEPDSADTKTGNNEDDVTEGMFDNVGGSVTVPDGKPARLRRSDAGLFNTGSGYGGSQIDVLGVQDVDNNPLWRFIPPNYGPAEATPADIPSSCKRGQFVDASDDYTTANLPSGVRSFIEALPNERERVAALLQRCLTHYRGLSWDGFPAGSLSPAEGPSGCTGSCDDPVFALNSSTEDNPDLWDIQYTPRFGYVPKIAGFPPGGSQARSFIAFRPIFIQRLVLERPGADTIWDPGTAPVPPTSGSYQRLGEVSVFVFPTGMLPGELDSAGAPFDVDENRFVSLVR